MRRNKDIITTGIGGLAVAAALMSCSSDKPDYLEPHITTLPATGITRTEATLNGMATVEGETQMPQLRFRYGLTEGMTDMTAAIGGDGSAMAATIYGLTAATTYYYMLEATNGRTTVRGNTLTLTTLPNDKPAVGDAAILSHGPMSAIVGYDITDDGGEEITETGCLYALSASADEKTRTKAKDSHGGKGRYTVLLSGLNRNTAYTIWPYAVSRMGETIGVPIQFATGDAVSLAAAGQLRTLLGSGLYEYSQLSIAGPLDGDDLRCLREMAGRGLDNKSTSGKLAAIDLTDARIVAGGEPYDGSRYAADNIVGQGLFADCSQLRNIALPTGTATIEKDAFLRCTSLESIDIPASATAVLPSSGCTALRSIGVSGANTSYVGRDGVLLNADASRIVWFPMGKGGSYSLPSTVTAIGDYAFRGCSIESFAFPDNITQMGTGVFMNSKVREVRMPGGLRLVPTATFQGCSQLHTVRLGSKTDMISDYAFDGCPLTDIYVDAQLPPVCNVLSFASGSGADVFQTCCVHVPKGRANMYKAADGWKLFKNIITD